MKFILTITCLCLLTISRSQSVSSDEFRSLIPLIENGDYRSAFKKSSDLLENRDKDGSELRAIVLYMNLYSSAGMVSLNQMTHDVFFTNANKYLGERILMAAHPCIDSSKLAFNSLKFVMKDGELHGSVATTNNSKTSIFAFEDFDFRDPVEPQDFIGKIVRCGGILKLVEVNPNKSTVWISRIFVSDAFIRVVQ